MLTLENLKKSMRLYDADADETALQAALDAATEAILTRVKRPLTDAETDLPKSLETAVYLLAADLFDNPSASLEKKLEENGSYRFLLSMHLMPEVY